MDPGGPSGPFGQAKKDLSCSTLAACHAATVDQSVSLPNQTFAPGYDKPGASKNGE